MQYSTHQMVLVRFFNWYTNKLKERSLRIRSITTCIILATGDVVAQRVIEKKSGGKVDHLRTAQMMVYGLIVLGTCLNKWYGTMDRLFVVRSFAGNRTLNPIWWLSHSFHNLQSRHLKLLQFVPTNAIIRVALDRMSIAPATLLMFFGWMTFWNVLREEWNNGKEENKWSVILERFKIRILDRIHYSFLDSYYAGWKLWIPAQMINFSIIPPIYRVLYANYISFCWNAYLSYK